MKPPNNAALAKPTQNPIVKPDFILAKQVGCCWADPYALPGTTGILSKNSVIVFGLIDLLHDRFEYLSVLIAVRLRDWDDVKFRELIYVQHAMWIWHQMEWDSFLVVFDNMWNCQLHVGSHYQSKILVLFSFLLCVLFQFGVIDVNAQQMALSELYSNWVFIALI